MKIAAFSAGRKNCNTEVFVKEALMAAEELGVQVELYRLNDFELHNCSACSPRQCPAMFDMNACPYKDDTPFLVDRFLDCDGVLIAGPVYSLTGSSLFFTFRDRVFGPKMDVAHSRMGHPEAPFVKGRFKARPGALISVGGALTENWTSLGLASLFSATFSAQTEVVDHMNVYGIADQGAATLRPDLLERARQVGRNLAQAVLEEDNRWRGGEKGVCPQCHLSLLEIQPGTTKVLCPVCGIYGEIEAHDGKSTIVWPDDQAHRRDNRLTIEGKQVHLEEIMECVMDFKPREAEAKENMKKYIAYDPTVKSPLREAKRAALREQLLKEKEAQE